MKELVILDGEWHTTKVTIAHDKGQLTVSTGAQSFSDPEHFYASNAILSTPEKIRQLIEFLEGAMENLGPGNRYVELERQGFNHGTNLIQNESRDRWGLHPDYPGNSMYETEAPDDYEPYVIWIGDQAQVLEFTRVLALAMLCRVHVEWRNLLISPHSDGSCCVKIEYKDDPGGVESKAEKLGPFKIGLDAGRFALIWYEQTLMALTLFGHYGFDHLEAWLLGERDTHYGRGVPGEKWADRRPVLYRFEEDGHSEHSAFWCSWCGEGMVMNEEEEKCLLCQKKEEEGKE